MLKVLIKLPWRYNIKLSCWSLSFCLSGITLINLWRVSSLKSHTLCPNLKATVNDSLTVAFNESVTHWPRVGTRHRTAWAAKTKMWGQGVQEDDLSSSQFLLRKIVSDRAQAHPMIGAYLKHYKIAPRTYWGVEMVEINWNKKWLKATWGSAWQRLCSCQAHRGDQPPENEINFEQDDLGMASFLFCIQFVEIKYEWFEICERTIHE